MISAARHLLFYLFVFTSTQISAQELEIKRTEKVITPIAENGLPAGWKRLGDDLFRVRLFLPYFSEQLHEPPSSDSVDDPFADGTPKTLTAQQALEAVGIPFNELASASYDPTTKIMTVINTANSIELINACVSSYIGSGPPAQVSTRLEIYEVTKLQALQLQESAESKRNHAPERAAALAAVREGNAKLATVISVTTNIGQRVELVDAIEFLTPSEATNENPDGYDSEKVGTVLKVEPNVDADGVTISLHLTVDHHTAPPEFDGKLPKFHAKSIVTNVTLSDGKHLLIGNWTPTGKPEYADGNLSQVAFITASIQNPEIELSPGSIITEEEEETE